MCLCLGCGGVGGVGGEYVGAWTSVWMGGVVLLLCELWVWIICVDGSYRYLYTLYMYCAKQIHVHHKCTQCSILVHLIDICFLPCIYL